MHVVILRPCMVYGRGGRGNLDRMAHSIAHGRFPPLPKTHNRRSLVHVDDLISAMRLVLERPEANGKSYIIASHEAPSGRELYDAIRAALGLPSISWAVPGVSLTMAGLMGDAIERIGRRPFAINSEAVSRLLGSAHYSPSLIEKELGWRAKVSLNQGLNEMLG
jgi:nucleoside-diphosphate-sugar epimerase